MDCKVKQTPDCWANPVGMWRCRNGQIAIVEYKRRYGNTRFPLVGATALHDAMTWISAGFRFSTAEPDEWDLIEKLSDKVYDPATWKPPLELKEGLWERSDGSVGNLEFWEDQIDGFPWRWMGCKEAAAWYSNDGSICLRPDIALVRYLGPSPLRGPTK